jgi:predicted metal-dependent hydrolase
MIVSSLILANIKHLKMNAPLDNYTVVRSSKRKTAVIQIRHEGVVVRVPSGVSDQWVSQWLNSKKGWIENQLTHLKKGIEDHSIRLENGGYIPFNGRELRITWHYGQKQDAYLEQDELIVVLSKRSPKPEVDQVKAILKKWYREQAEQYISARVQVWQARMKLSPNSIQVRDYKRRWGSCSATGDLSFNWRLIFGETELIDYVVIHELAHIKHLNHSRAFWLLVESYCSDWRSKRKALHQRTSWILW